MAIILNEKLVRTPRMCHGVKFEDELMLWSKGAIGMLSDEQEKLCVNPRIEPIKEKSPKFLERLQVMSKLGKMSTEEMDKAIDIIKEEEILSKIKKLKE